MSWLDEDAVGLAALVRSSEIDPVDLVERALERIAALDPALGAVVALDPDGARQAAASVPRDLPLAGVPILIKDTNVDVEGYATRHGSRFYAEAPVAKVDSELVRRLRAAGTIILGKTKTPEFAGDFVTEPRWLGPARNPWDPTRTPGGSSGGAAAAVAARMVPVAHGTDCGGSIRVPAACCGLVGLKPTRGRTPSGPEAGERVSGLNSDFVLTRTVRDTAALLDVLAGPDPGAPYLAPDPGIFWSACLTAPLRRLRIGVTMLRPDGTPSDPEIAEAVDALAAWLAGEGHAIEPFVWPDLAEAADAAAMFWQMEIGELVEQRVRALGRPPREDEIEVLSRISWEGSRRASAFDYMAARAAQNRVSRRVAAAMAPFDLLLTPTNASLPPPIGGLVAPGGWDYDYWIREAYRFAPFTELFNLTGQPAISLPAAVSPAGLPIGVQLVGRFGDDATLLRLAQDLEDATGWPHRRPALAV